MVLVGNSESTLVIYMSYFSSSVIAKEQLPGASGKSPASPTAIDSSFYYYKKGLYPHVYEQTRSWPEEDEEQLERKYF